MALGLRVVVLGLAAACGAAAASLRHHARPSHPAKVLLGTKQDTESRAHTQIRMRALQTAHARLEAVSELQDGTQAELHWFTAEEKKTFQAYEPVASLLETSSLYNLATSNQTSPQKESGAKKLALPKTQEKVAAQKARMEDTKKTLDGLYKHLKTNIGYYNKKQKEMKSRSEMRLEKAEAMLKKDQEKMKDKSLGAFDKELLRNQTSMALELVDYWKKVTVSEKQQFHSSLKLTHTLMDRVKLATKMYAMKLAGKKIDPKMMQDLVSSLPPKMAFTQYKNELSTFHDTMRSLLRKGVRATLRFSRAALNF